MDIPSRIISRRQPVLLDTVITSNYYITSARAFIVRAETGAVLRSARTNFTGTKEFMLAGSPVCTHLNINFLPEGNFYFVLEATDQLGTRELQRTSFQVRTSDPIIWVNHLDIPTFITHGDEINLTGYLSSWTDITNVRTYFINRDNGQRLQQFSHPVADAQNIFQLENSPLCQNAIFANLLPGRYTFVLRGSNAYGEDLMVQYFQFFVRPQAPANLEVSGVNHEGVTLTWNPVIGATGYRIYHGNGTLAGVASGTSITLRGLAENTPFVFVVVATSAGGDSAPSNPASIQTSYAPPLPPTGLVVRETTDTTARLEWAFNPVALNGYRIYANGIFAGATSAANQTTFTVTGLAPNRQHNFTIIAVGTGGNSPSSPNATAWTLPSAPSDAGAVSVTHHSARLTWRASYGNILGYRIYLDGVIFGTTMGNVTHFDVRDMLSHTLHNFTIVAVGQGGYSAHSNVIPVFTRSRPPENLRHNNVTHNSATLHWDAVFGAVSYRIYDEQERLLGTSTDTTLDVSGLIPNTRQLLTVVSVDANGNPSGHSIPTVFHTLVGAVTDLQSANATSNSARLTWNAPLGGATEYRIYLNGNLISITQNRHFDLGNLAPNTSNTFAVRAVGFTGDSLLLTETVFWTAPRYPSPIYYRDLRHNSVAIEFTTSVGGASYYRHYLDGVFVGTTQNSAGVMRFGFTNLRENTLYTLTVVAVGYSGIHSAPTSITVRTPWGPPSAPTNLGFSQTTYHSTLLMWTASTGNVTGYRVYRANGTLVGTTTNTSLRIENLSSGVNHSFFVVATGIGGRSERSVTATVAIPLPPVPNRPTGLGFTGTTHNSTTLIWNAATGHVSGYRIYRANGTLAGTTNGRNSTRFIITGLNPLTDYEFFVVAVGLGGRSGNSDTARVRTLATPPPPPSGGQNQPPANNQPPPSEPPQDDGIVLRPQQPPTSPTLQFNIVSPTQATPNRFNTPRHTTRLFLAVGQSMPMLNYLRIEELRYYVSEFGVVRMNSDGTITGLRHGSTLVDFYVNGQFAGRIEYWVFGEAPPAFISNRPPNDTMFAPLTPRNSPFTRQLGSNRELEWRSSIPGIASISADGLIRTHAPGQTVIFAICRRTNTGAGFLLTVVPQSAGHNTTREQERVSCNALSERALSLMNTPRFDQDAWNSATEGVRRGMLNIFRNDLNRIMGITSPRQERLAFDDLGRGIAGLYNRHTGQITINNYFLQNSDNPRDMERYREQALLTVIHETRHEFQHFAIHNHNRFAISYETRSYWAENALLEQVDGVWTLVNYVRHGVPEYYAQPTEWDAWHFEDSGDRAREALEQAGIRPVYEGSWPW